MRFFWRSQGNRIPSYADWIGRLDKKNQVKGTSAPTLATAWSGPLDLLNALGTQPTLASLTILEAVIEKRATFDDYPGNVRNHDLLLRARNADGEHVTVCVEAKAGEPLGATVADQHAAALVAKSRNPASNAAARVTDLVDRYCRYPLRDQRTSQLRYQLLTAWAGTLEDAAASKHAVLAVHEFRTEQRPADKTAVNGAELERFADVVLGCTLPASTSTPWCVRVPDVVGVDTAFHVAHCVTNLPEGLRG